MPQLLSLFLVFVFVGLSSAEAWAILAVLLLLLLGGILRGLICVLGLEALSIVRPRLGMVVNLHLTGVAWWVLHGVIGIVSIWGGRRGVLGVGRWRNRWGRRGRGVL